MLLLPGCRTHAARGLLNGIFLTRHAPQGIELPGRGGLAVTFFWWWPQHGSSICPLECHVYFCITCILCIIWHMSFSRGIHWDLIVWEGHNVYALCVGRLKLCLSNWHSQNGLPRYRYRFALNLATTISWYEYHLKRSQMLFVNTQLNPIYYIR